MNFGMKTKFRRKQILPPMAKGQQGSITILFGIKGYDVGKVRIS
jgi:hypothetical protein